MRTYKITLDPKLSQRWIICTAVWIASHHFATGFVLAQNATYSFDVAQIHPKNLKLGGISLTTGKNETKVVFKNMGGYEVHLLYSENKTIIREIEKGSDIVEIRRTLATGRIASMPLLPPGILSTEFVRAGSKSKNVMIAELCAVTDGGPFFEFGNVKSHEEGGVQRVDMYEVMLNGRLKTRWSYSEYKLIKSRWVPTVIVRNRFKSSGFNIESDDEVIWNLNDSYIDPNATLAESKFIPDNMNIQDNRGQDKPVSFTFQRVNGTLDEQADLALKKAGIVKSEISGSRGQEAKLSLWVPWVIGGGGMVIGFYAIRRKSKC